MNNTRKLAIKNLKGSDEEMRVPFSSETQVKTPKTRVIHSVRIIALISVLSAMLLMMMDDVD